MKETIIVNLLAWLILMALVFASALMFGVAFKPSLGLGLHFFAAVVLTLRLLAQNNGGAL